MAKDSSLSIAANIIGILTFIFAVAAAIYARWLWLRSRIVPSQNLELLCQLYLNIKETTLLGARLDFLPSAYLQDMFHEVYGSQLDSTSQARRHLAKHAIRRLGSREPNTLSEIMRELESRMSTLSMWCMQEQLSAGFDRLNYERRLLQMKSSLASDDRLSMENRTSHAQVERSAAKASAKDALDQQWQQARDRLRRGMTPAELKENTICTQYDLHRVVDKLMRENAIEIELGLGRLV